MATELRWFASNSSDPTIMPKPIIERETVTLDATGRPIGRIATEIATLLMGKNKATYTPNIDAGAVVNVENAGKVKITGKKIDQKKYYSHSGFPGGLKTKTLGEVMAKNPSDAIYRAVDKMLPKNTLRSRRLARLHIK